MSRALIIISMLSLAEQSHGSCDVGQISCSFIKGAPSKTYAYFSGCSKAEMGAFTLDAAMKTCKNSGGIVSQIKDNSHPILDKLDTVKNVAAVLASFGIPALTMANIISTMKENGKTVNPYGLWQKIEGIKKDLLGKVASTPSVIVLPETTEAKKAIDDYTTHSNNVLSIQADTKKAEKDLSSLQETAEDLRQKQALLESEHLPDAENRMKIVDNTLAIQKQEQLLDTHRQRLQAAEEALQSKKIEAEKAQALLEKSLPSEGPPPLFQKTLGALARKNIPPKTNEELVNDIMNALYLYANTSSGAAPTHAFLKDIKAAIKKNRMDELDSILASMAPLLSLK